MRQHNLSKISLLRVADGKVEDGPDERAQCQQPRPNKQADRFILGKLTKECTHCGASRFDHEKTNCCHNGKISLPALKPYPQDMKALLNRNSAQAQNFMDNIRKFNSAMAFVSFGARIAIPQVYGPYCFKIHGQLCHQTGSLFPEQGKVPLYSQLYIIEGDQAVESRLQQRENHKGRRDTMEMLTETMSRINLYAEIYSNMKKVHEEQQLEAQRHNIDMPEVKMFIRRGTHKRRYNEPRYDEVAAIFVGDSGCPPENRDIVVYPHNIAPQNIRYTSHHIDPMVYPILFPHGELGWSPGKMHQEAHRTRQWNTIYPLQFYNYRLAVKNTFSPIFQCGKLLQQYIVDSYVRTETAILHFVRHNQAQLRVELYQGLLDHLHFQAEQQNLELGKVVILPLSFQGSPKVMQQNYQDAMAIVSKYRKPDIFLTFTCNPKSKDILDNLLDGHEPADRPDICSVTLTALLISLFVVVSVECIFRFCRS